MSNSSEYQIPDNWFNTTIEEVCTDPQYGYTTRASKTGDLKLLRTTDITSGTIKWDRVPFCSENPDELEKYKLYDGDVVISRSGSIGMSYLIQTPTNSVFASYLIRFKPLINKQFFKYFLDSPFYWSAIGENKLGIAVQNINATKLKEISLPLPPLNEQKRIVNKIEELLSELDHAVENFKKIQQQLKIYRQAVLKAAFEGKLTEEWKKFNSQNINLDPSRSFVEIKKLGDLIEEPKYGTSKKCSYENGNLGVLRIPNLVDYKIDLDDLKKAEFNESEKEAYSLKKGDLLIIRSNGSPSLVGTASIIDSHSSKCLFAGYLIRLRCLNSLNPNYLLYCLHSYSVRNQIELQSRSTSGVHNINSQEIKSLLIPYCSPPEQNQIVQEIESRLSICDELEKTIEQNLILEKSLRQSILKKAFEGKLVPQDPNDEPAELLLEKIKLEKEKLANSNQTKTKREKVTA